MIPLILNTQTLNPKHQIRWESLLIEIEEISDSSPRPRHICAPSYLRKMGLGRIAADIMSLSVPLTAHHGVVPRMYGGLRLIAEELGLLMPEEPCDYAPVGRGDADTGRDAASPLPLQGVRERGTYSPLGRSRSGRLAVRPDSPASSVGFGGRGWGRRSASPTSTAHRGGTPTSIYSRDGAPSSRPSSPMARNVGSRSPSPSSKYNLARNADSRSPSPFSKYRWNEDEWGDDDDDIIDYGGGGEDPGVGFDWRDVEEQRTDNAEAIRTRIEQDYRDYVEALSLGLIEAHNLPTDFRDYYEGSNSKPEIRLVTPYVHAHDQVDSPPEDPILRVCSRDGLEPLNT